MKAEPRSIRFGSLIFDEIRERAEAGWLAVIPTGCTEQQGPHLPVDYDTWFVEAACLAGVRRANEEYGVKALVLPTLPFGPTPEHRGFGSGFIDLPQEIHEAVVAAVLDSLVDQRFRRLIVWRGCGQHDLTGVVAQFNAKHRGQAKAFQPDMPYHAIWCRLADPSVPGGHADSFATSIALHLRPESVRVERIPAADLELVDWGDPNLDFSRYSSTGVIGDQKHASAELGAGLWKAVVAEIASTLQEVVEVPLT